MEDKARAQTPEPEQRVYLGVSVLQGLILAAVSVLQEGRLLETSYRATQHQRISLYINLL